MKVLFLDTAHPFLKVHLEKNGFTCEEDFTSSKEEIEKKIFKYNGIILRSRINIDKFFIDRLTADLIPGPSPAGEGETLRFVARIGAGMEHIDVVYAESKGVKCIASPEGNRNAVAEHALGMLLNLLNNISKANAEVKAGQWLREVNRGTELEGKTIAIYGYGNTGSAFAKILSGFDIKILSYDKYKPVPPPWGARGADIFSQTDILSLHLPLTDETKYLVNDSFLSKFKKNIYLINTSRGPIVKTDDLVKNLKRGKVLGACLDVIEYEATSFEAVKPETSNLKPGMADDWKYLKASSKVILTPHIAGWSFESTQKMANILAEKILTFVKPQK